MSEHKTYPATSFQKFSLNIEDYKKKYKLSINNPEEFWQIEAQKIKWKKPWTQVKHADFKSPVDIRWFEGGQLNITQTCLDENIKKNPNKIAFYWEPDQPDEESQSITYELLYNEVNKLCHSLKHMGVKKGDRVTLYLPMIPEAVYSMLACARIGAIHSVVFAGFSQEALLDRLDGCASEWIITADEGRRAGKRIPLLKNTNQAVKNSRIPIKKIIVVQNTGDTQDFNPKMNTWYHEAVKSMPTDFNAEVMDAEDPLFILYTSGSTNKPKGILHTTGGYAVYVRSTFEYVFAHQESDVYWCAADIGWITGHSYMVYGPLLTGATSVLFEGVPTCPTPERIWQIVDKYKVNTLYTAPTLIRALMREGNQYLQSTNRSSLKVLGSVGEPINPEAWEWYFEYVGHRQCPIVDTWWQTETGGVLISPLPGVTDLKPGSATLPLFGIRPVIVNEKGEELLGEAEGLLCIKGSWPGQMRSIYNDVQRFNELYFKPYEGLYFTGDGCRRDADGFYWITGRVDDVLNVSGHRMGSAEIESALVEHDDVSEAAVVGYPHEIKGQGIYAYVTLMSGITPSDTLKNQLIALVSSEIGAFAKPDKIQWAQALPKTRSGKIMRRILRKVAENQIEQLGDISTLADPQVVDELIKNKL